MSILRADHLAIGYKARPNVVVAHDLTLALKSGELVCLLGPNGAGKSTLMRTLAGMQAPLDGHVILLGDPISTLKPSELARRLSIVLTGRVSTGLLTGYGLVALGRHPYSSWTGRLSRHDEAVIRWAVNAVGAEELAPRRVLELSDGERQKLMIARALAQEPDVILLDEPTAFLDLPRRVEMMRLLRHLAEETGRAILVSTHDLDLALRSAHKLWLMPRGGHLEVGTPEDLILKGAFESAFRAEGVTFDPQTGAFKIHRAIKGEIQVIGEGIPALWTIRALEREGYCIAVNGHPPQFRIEVTNAQSWMLHSAQSSQQYNSIEALLAAIKDSSPTPQHNRF